MINPGRAALVAELREAAAGFLRDFEESNATAIHDSKERLRAALTADDATRKERAAVAAQLSFAADGTFAGDAWVEIAPELARRAAALLRGET